MSILPAYSFRALSRKASDEPADVEDAAENDHGEEDEDEVPFASPPLRSGEGPCVAPPFGFSKSLLPQPLLLLFCLAARSIDMRLAPLWLLLPLFPLPLPKPPKSHKAQMETMIKQSENNIANIVTKI